MERKLKHVPPQPAQTAKSVGGGAPPPRAEPDRREQRIAEHLQQSLAHDDPLRATLGATSADLMLVQRRLNELLVAASKECRSLRQIEQLEFALDASLRISKTIAQNSQLELRLAEARRAGESDNAQRSHSARDEDLKS